MLLELSVFTDARYSMLLNWQAHIVKSEKIKLPTVMTIQLVNLILPNKNVFSNKISLIKKLKITKINEDSRLN